jgi:hypothetical protein
MRLSVFLTSAIAGVSLAAAAVAQPAASAPELKHGAMISSADGARVGPIDYIEKGKDKDATPSFVGVIRDMHMVHIPVSTLSAGPKGLVTSLKISEVDKLQ